jgi:16S rRNA processing protein RimM
VSAARICLGVIVGVKGVRGEVRIKPFTEDAADVASYGPLMSKDGRSFTVKITGFHQGVVIAKFDGVADRDAAEALKGVELFVDRAKLPAPEDGSFYYSDLIGLAAKLTDGTDLGTVATVDNFGAGDVMEIAAADGTTAFVPFNPSVVAKVDLGAGTVTFDPVPGMFGAGEKDDGEDEENERGGDAA